MEEIKNTKDLDHGDSGRGLWKGHGGWIGKEFLGRKGKFYFGNVELK